MKKLIRFLLLIVFLLITIIGKTQTTFWSTNNTTSALGTEYLGANPSSTADLDIKMRANFNMKFYTNDLQRMTLSTFGINNVQYTRMGINAIGSAPITFPRSILHLGHNYLTGTGMGAWRQWMNIGTFSVIGTDFCYFGLVDNPTDTNVTLGSSQRADAVVAWGDNINGPEGADNLRFVFSASYNSGAIIGNSTLWNSAEVARFAPTGRLGIGNFGNVGTAYPGGANGSGIQPLRRLEIYDEHLDPFINAANPQLRLTYTPNANVTLGIHVDFQATNLGDLFIHAQNGGAVANVGINTSTPERTLEVFENGPDPQFRISNVISTTASVRRHVDFQATDLGNLFIHPQNGVNPANVGINTSTPQRTLEVFDNSTNPQLRISHVVSTTAASRRYADFKSTSSGDLIITTKAGSTDGKVGINTINPPGNTLTINGGTITPGNSGLQFVHLTSAFIPTVQPNGKVLTVDGSGNVVLTNDQGAGNFTSCGGTGTANHIMKYTDNAGTIGCQAFMQEDVNGFVGMGIAPIINQGLSVAYTNLASGNSTGIAIATGSSLGTNTGIAFFPGAFANTLYGTYLQSTSTATTIANSHKYGHFVDLGGNNTFNTGYLANITGGTNSVSTYGFYARTTGAISGTDPSNYGVEVMASGTDAKFNYGVHGKGTDGINAIGVFGYGLNGSVLNIGVDALAYGTGNTDSYGVRAQAFSPALNNFGVWGYAATGTNNYGIYGVSPSGTCTTAGCTDAAGYFDGDVFVTNGTFIASDIKFKQNVTDLQNVSAIIDALQPKTFTFDSLNYPGIYLPVGLHYGLIAQDVESVLPGLVKNTHQPESFDSSGTLLTVGIDYKAINYTELIPILLAELKTERHTLDSVMVVLSTVVGSHGHCRIRNENPTQTIELSNNQGIILNQNDPNPFAESTQITYFIPEEIKEAKIMFSDNKGTVLRSAKIDSRGEGTLEVYASELSSGIYTYTLICDGKVIESKKMMKTK